MRKPILSITIRDCEVQTFRSGGKGGQHQNKTESGVRIIHRESGAIGQSRDERSQFQNKRKAWKRMAESKVLKRWLRLKLSRQAGIDDWVKKQMKPENLKIEVIDSQKKLLKS